MINVLSRGNKYVSGPYSRGLRNSSKPHTSHYFPPCALLQSQCMDLLQILPSMGVSESLHVFCGGGPKFAALMREKGRGSKRTSESANWIISEGQKERGPSTQVDLLPPCSKSQTVRVCEWFGHVQFEFSTFVLFIFPVQCLPSYPALPKTLARFCGFVHFCCPL